MKRPMEIFSDKAMRSPIYSHYHPDINDPLSWPLVDTAWCDTNFASAGMLWDDSRWDALEFLPGHGTAACIRRAVKSL